MSKARVSEHHQSDETTVGKITAFPINKLRQAMKWCISSCFKSSHKHGISIAVGKRIAHWKNLCCHTVRSSVQHPESSGNYIARVRRRDLRQMSPSIHRDCDSPNIYTWACDRCSSRFSGNKMKVRFEVEFSLEFQGEIL